MRYLFQRNQENTYKIRHRMFYLKYKLPDLQNISILPIYPVLTIFMFIFCPHRLLWLLDFIYPHHIIFAYDFIPIIYNLQTTLLPLNFTKVYQIYYPVDLFPINTWIHINIQMSFNSALLDMATFNTLNEEIKVDQSPLPLQDEDKWNAHILSQHKKTTKTGTKRKERTQKVLEPGKLVGHWNNQEKKRYHWFLEMHHSHFENKHMRRMDKIFKSMSDFIGTRAADQCRSHHQKMEKKFKTFYKIIYNLRIQNYNSIEITEMGTELQDAGIIIPCSLIDANILLQQNPSGQQKTDKESLQCPNSPKIQNMKFCIENQDNFMKDFEFIEQGIHQPLI